MLSISVSRLLALSLVLHASGRCQERDDRKSIARQNVQSSMPAKGRSRDQQNARAWFNTNTTPRQPRITGLSGDIDVKSIPGGVEEITVLGQSRRRNDDWRLESSASIPQYEASNSDAAQPLVPFPSYTSLDQQRMMSEKTDMLGLCGALGGYIQCPNLPH